VNEKQGQAQGDANCADHNVRDAQEGILATEHGGGGQDHALGAVERDHRIFCNSRDKNVMI